MRKITKLLLISCILAALLSIDLSFAGIVDIPDSNDDIRKVSINATTGGDPVSSINLIGFSILTTVKLVLEGILVLFLVYTGIQMVMSMGTEEETLSKSKRQIYYALIGLVFVNIPGGLYQAFRNENSTAPSIGGNVNGKNFNAVDQQSNIFIDFFDFGVTFEQNIIGFIEVTIFGIAVFMLVYAGIRIMTSAGNDEKIKEGKNKIVWTLIGLIFIGFIESWKFVAYEGKVGDATDLFSKLANLALFFAGPLALFFLTLAGYYYITANGDEEKVKKAKSIIINTIIATLILLASYTFLLDLANL